MNVELANLCMNIINALGSLATCAGVWFFIKDQRDKQEQIEKLNNIASVLKASNEALERQNYLSEEQAKILHAYLVKDEEVLTQLQTLHNEKRKVRHKNHWWANLIPNNQEELVIFLQNKTFPLILQSIDVSPQEVQINTLPLPQQIEHDDFFYIKIQKFSTFTLTLKYKDTQHEHTAKLFVKNKKIHWI